MTLRPSHLPVHYARALGAGLVLLASTALGAESIRIRDLDTGALVPARVLIGAEPIGAGPPAAPAQLRIAPEGLLSTASLPDQAWLWIEAEGYAPLPVRYQAGAAGYSFWLRALAAPMETEVTTTTWRLQGYVRDGQSLAPIGGVRLRVEPFGIETVSGADGRYELSAAPIDGTRYARLYALFPGSDTAVLIDSTLPAAPGRVLRHVHRGEVERTRRHREFASPWELVWQDQQDRPAGPGAVAAERSIHDPPASIRVGFGDANCTASCCTGSCTHVCVFDLETYVRRGITHEWIASWQAHALRAGTVAYRAYGAWRVANPIRPTFDICSSACCQVNAATIHSSGSAAVARTRGLLLERNGLRFAAEYSAENNCLLGSMSCSNSDLSCGDGYNGSPSLGWPCLADPVGAGQDCFGHGRGMSQWGTQRWALAPHLRRWPWIVNHYYNALGTGTQQRTAQMTRVLALESAAVNPGTVAAGGSFAIELLARNRAAENHEQVLIGASIRQGSGPYYSDPANDRRVTLLPGSQTTTRDFNVPVGIASGSYALYLALYLDIDESGQIGSEDLLQATLTLPNALMVTAPSELLFANGFE